MKSAFKVFLVFCFVILVCGGFPIVDAGPTFEEYHLINETVLHIDAAVDPYYIDILVVEDDAPVFTISELTPKLPIEYRTGSFADTLNGYRDSDGFVSFRLYYERYFQILQIESHKYEYRYTATLPFRYKIILVFEDGTTLVSPEIIQQQNRSLITYDLEHVVIEESTFIDPNYTPFVPKPPIIAFFIQYTNASTHLLVLFVLFIQLLYFMLLGYRKLKSFAIVGGIRLLVLTLGTIMILLEVWFPSVPFALLFGIFFLAWMFVESFFLPQWIKERNFEKTMVYAWTTNVIMMIILLLNYLGY
jgi:hypothetical protein